MNNQELTISQAIDLICEEKKISREVVLLAIEQALAAAYRRDYGDKLQNIKVDFNPVDGSMKVYDVKTVVEDVPPEELEPKEPASPNLSSLGGPAAEKEEAETKKAKKVKKTKKETKKKEPAPEATPSEDLAEEKKRFNPKTDIQLSDAKKIDKKTKVGEIITSELPMPSGFGRVAAQTAKQVIVQKIREAERQTVFDRYKAQEGTVLNGIIQRFDRGMVMVELPDAVAIMPGSEQIMGERYMPNQKFKFYLQAVKQGLKGIEIIVSRRHPEILRELFRQEIPEISNGSVEIKGVAREAGSRAKVAVWTSERGVDAVGACIGQRGVRIQTIISELGGEKIDIIEWNDDIKKFLINSLSPAKIASIELDEANKKAVAKVRLDQLSLAIGRAGQNVRLASRLTGYEIDVQQAEVAEGEAVASTEQPSTPSTEPTEKIEEKTVPATPEAIVEKPVEAATTEEKPVKKARAKKVKKEDKES